MDELTPREREVLALVARGFSNQEIADRLVIAERTVRTHVSLSIRKLGVSNRAAAAILYIDATESSSAKEAMRLKRRLNDLQKDFAYIKILFDKFLAAMEEDK